MKQLDEVVQFGAPHSILDIGGSIRQFEGSIASEIDPDAQNIMLFEQSGVSTRDQAELISSDAAKRGSILESITTIDPRTYIADPNKPQATIDKLIFMTLVNSPDTDHKHSLFAISFFDWISKKHEGKANINFIPESYESEDVLEEIREVNDLVFNSLSIGESSLDDLISQFRSVFRRLRTAVTTRDREIAKYVSDLLRTQSETRRKVIVVIGSGHKTIKDSVDPDVISPNQYREIIHHQPIERGELEANFLDESLTKEKAARLLCYRVVSRNIKTMFLHLYKHIYLKEPATDDQGRTAFDYAYELIQGMPIESIYSFLQNFGRIDCGVSKKKVKLSFPLAYTNKRFIQNLRKLVISFGGHDLRDTEIGIYIERRFILNFLSLSFDISSEPGLKNSLLQLLDALPDSFIMEFAEEVRSAFLGDKQGGLSYLQKIIDNVLPDQNRFGIDLRPLRNCLISKGIIISTPQGVRVNLKLENFM